MKKTLFLLFLFCGLCAIRISPVWSQYYVFEESDLTGEPAPDFTVESVRLEKGWFGGVHPKWSKKNLAKFRAGDKAIIYFWATWCPNCGDFLTNLNSRSEVLAKEGVKILPINIGDPKKQVENYLKKNKIDLDVFVDANEEVESAYKIYGVPTFYFVNQDGKITAIRHRLPDDYHTLLKYQETTQE